MAKLRLLFAAVLAALLWACGNSDRFHVEGTIEGAPTMNLRYMYYAGGALQTGLTAARDGKFIFEGDAREPAIVEITDNDYRLMGRFVVRNGENIHLELERHNPMAIKAKGNQVSEEWARWLGERVERLRTASPASRNAMVAEYVAANPSSMLSSILLMTEFDSSTDAGAVLADSLMSLLEPEARPAGMTAGYRDLLRRVVASTAREPLVAIPYRAHGNRTLFFNPRRSSLSLLALSEQGSGRDSLVATLRRLHSHEAEGRFAILDLALDQDTMVWHNAVRADSAKWEQGWGAGSLSASGIDRLGIPRLPYFIVADSTGRQLWRGSSAGEVERFVINHLTSN